MAQVGEEPTSQAPASRPSLPHTHGAAGDPGRRCPLPWAPMRGHQPPQGSHLFKTKAPSAEEVPGRGALFLESPKASFPGQISHPHTPPRQPGGRTRKPSQSRNQKASRQREAGPTALLLRVLSVPGGGCLAFSAPVSGCGLRTIFIPLCHMGMVPLETLGVGRGSQEDQLLKKLR